MPHARGRFAPSPTGPLHLGGLATALFAWASATKGGGTVALRVEDLDRARIVPGSAEEQLGDLAWAGLTFEPDVIVQSTRLAAYEAAVASLAARGLVYACDCSRAELRAAEATIGAPHAGEEGPRYAGTCSGAAARARTTFRRPPATRLAVPAGAVPYVDGVRGPQEEDVAALTGDFVLRRGDGVFTYQLAVTVDDAAMGVTEVVRGADLAPSAARQVCLMRLLREPGAPSPPVYVHVPLVVGEGGAKLSKRDGGFAVASYRTAGVAPSALLTAVARAFGQEVSDEAAPLASLARSFDAARFPAHDVPLSEIVRGLGPSLR